jgi:hypothetical protein
MIHAPVQAETLKRNKSTPWKAEVQLYRNSYIGKGEKRAHESFFPLPLFVPLARVCRE